MREAFLEKCFHVIGTFFWTGKLNGLCGYTFLRRGWGRDRFGEDFNFYIQGFVFFGVLLNYLDNVITIMSLGVSSVDPSNVDYV